MHKDLLSLRVHRQIGNWTEYRERHPNSDKLTHSAMNAPPFSNSLPTRGEKEKGREREREREKKKKKKITATSRPLNWLETRQARKYEADELQFCRSNLKLFISLPFLRKLVQESNKSFESSFFILVFSIVSLPFSFYLRIIYRRAQNTSFTVLKNIVSRFTQCSTKRSNSIRLNGVVRSIGAK